MTTPKNKLNITLKHLSHARGIMILHRPSVCLILENKLQYLKNAFRECLQICNKRPLGWSRVNWSRFGGRRSKVESKGQGQCGHFCEHNIPETPWGNFFKFAINNRPWVKGPMPRSMWPNGVACSNISNCKMLFVYSHCFNFNKTLYDLKLYYPIYSQNSDKDIKFDSKQGGDTSKRQSLSSKGSARTRNTNKER